MGEEIDVCVVEYGRRKLTFPAEITQRHKLYDGRPVTYAALSSLFADNRDRWCYVNASFYMALLNRRWIDASVGSKRWKAGVPTTVEHTDPEHEHNSILIASAMTLHKYVTWYVEIGRDDGISFRFPTRPENLGTIFRLRDLPDGAARRAALRAWVTDHWRSDHRDPEMEIYVRKHLRGAETFRWDGYYCTIVPAQIELELNEALAAERAAMGAQAHRPKTTAVVKPRVRVPALYRQVPELQGPPSDDA
jgi:hypothetical protein